MYLVMYVCMYECMYVCMYVCTSMYDVCTTSYYSTSATVQ